MGWGFKSAATKQSDRLIEAIRKGDVAGVKEWLANGASPSDTGSGDLTPLAVAARLNEAGCAEALISALEPQGSGSPRLREGVCKYPKVSGAHQSDKGVSALQEAARCGSLECVQLLARRGWDMEEKGPEGKTALSWACSRRRLEAAKALIALGAKAEGLGEDLVNACQRNHADIAEALLLAGCPADSPASHGRTALMVAAEQNSSRLAELLISHGASVEARSDDGSTALHFAARCDGSDVAGVLMRAGASALTPNNRGLTPLDVSRGAGGDDEDEDDEDDFDHDDDDEPDARGVALNAAGRVMAVFMERQELEETARFGEAKEAKKARL